MDIYSGMFDLSYVLQTIRKYIHQDNEYRDMTAERENGGVRRGNGNITTTTDSVSIWLEDYTVRTSSRVHSDLNTMTT
jgi:hypothetical protein